MKQQYQLDIYLIAFGTLCIQKINPNDFYAKKHTAKFFHITNYAFLCGANKIIGVANSYVFNHWSYFFANIYQVVS